MLVGAGDRLPAVNEEGTQHAGTQIVNYFEPRRQLSLWQIPHMQDRWPHLLEVLDSRAKR